MSDENKSLAQYTPRQIFDSQKVIKRFSKTFGDDKEKASGFVSSVLQVINDNDKLANADSESVFNAAMTAATLNLPVNPNLGFAYIIPYNVKGRGVVAQFQMGYKGYIQLCQRSGQFRTISATEVYEGQVVEENPLTGFKFNFNNKSSDMVVGYAAYFELLNGFQKTLYMTMEEVEDHAVKYSQSYKGKDKKNSFGPWVDNFHAMAIKTVLKLLLSKFAPMTIEMEKAIEFDQAEVKNGMEINYIDNDQTPEQQTENRQQIDTQRPTVDEETGEVEQAEEVSLFDEVMELGKQVHGKGWYKESKVLADNISDGNAGNMKELDETGLLQAKKILEAKVAEVA